jgi:phage terminase small subunit
VTYRQWKFVEGFAIHGNATKAAREAGYSLNGINRMGYYLKNRLKYEIYYWSCTKKERAEIAMSVLHDERRRLKLEQVIRLSEREGKT